MSNLKALRARAADLRHEVANATRERASIGDVCLREKRSLTEPERAVFVAKGTALDALQSQLDATERELAGAEEANEAERRADAIPDGEDPAVFNAARGGGALPARPGGRRWAELFPSVRGASHGWTSEREFVNAVASGRADHRLMLQAAVMSGSDGPQGLVVPDSMSAVWMDESLPNEIVRPRAINWPMPTRSRSIPAWDLSDRSDGNVAGLTLQWVGEGGTNVPQSAKPRIIILNANKAAIYADPTSELLADGMSFDEQLRLVLRRALGVGLDRAFLFGTGVAQPLGALVSNAAIHITREEPGTIVYGDLLQMYSRLLPSATDAVWLASPSTIPALARLVVEVGTGGSVIPVMSESDGTFRILTRPVVFTDLMKPIGQPLDIALASFAGYNVGFRREMSIETSVAPGWYKDLVSFRLLLRADGQPSDAGPVQPENNAPTQSSFITLE